MDFKEVRKPIYQDLIDGQLSIDQADEELQIIFNKEHFLKEKKSQNGITEAKVAWRFGSKKEAIKILRQTTGMSLKRCKEFCEENF